MKNKKLLHWTNISFGFSVGIFSSFFIIVVFLTSYFDKPWDTLFTVTMGIVGPLIGSLVGGFIAYKIAFNQIEFQQEQQKKIEMELQENYASLIKTELEKNDNSVKKLNELLSEFEKEFMEIAKSITEGKQVTEGILTFVNQIETDMLLQLRTNVFDTKYISLHRNIELLVQVKEISSKLHYQSTPEYINLSLKSLLKLTNEYITRDL